MSDTAGTSLNQAQEVAWAVMWTNWMRAVAFLVLYYDHALTLKDEVQYIWLRPKSPWSIGFIINRYSAFLGGIVYGFWSLSANTEDSCHHQIMFWEILVGINQFIVGALLLVRTYAVYGRSKRILVFLVVMAVLCTIGATLPFAFNRGAPRAHVVFGCHYHISEVAGIVQASPWEAVFVWDLIVTTLTLKKTVEQRRLRGGPRPCMVVTRGLPLVDIVLRDGLAYFIAMSLANLINILTYYFLHPYLKGCISSLAATISVTLIARLIINVHRCAEASAHDHSMPLDDHRMRSLSVWHSTSTRTRCPNELILSTRVDTPTDSNSSFDRDQSPSPWYHDDGSGTATAIGTNTYGRSRALTPQQYESVLDSGNDAGSAGARGRGGRLCTGIVMQQDLTEFLD